MDFYAFNCKLQQLEKKEFRMELDLHWHLLMLMLLL